MTLEEAIGAILQKRSLTIGLAESCTGGLIAGRITNVPGSSAYFEAGLVTYGNKAKTKFLSVPDEIIAKHGAVSNPVAELMAKGVRDAAAVDIGLSITGIAGPGGGSEQKPVGTVFIGLAAKGGAFVRKFLLSGDRCAIREQASEEALIMLLDYLEGRPI
jgi:nicotinamide-nucleotide amidase